jgi:hypothetical protein
MTTIIAGMQNSVLVLESSKTGWKTHEKLRGSHPQCIAFDRKNPKRVYCGTFDKGKSCQFCYQLKKFFYSCYLLYHSPSSCVVLQNLAIGKVK